VKREVDCERALARAAVAVNHHVAAVGNHRVVVVAEQRGGTGLVDAAEFVERDDDKLGGGFGRSRVFGEPEQRPLGQAERPENVGLELVAKQHRAALAALPCDVANHEHVAAKRAFRIPTGVVVRMRARIQVAPAQRFEHAPDVRRGRTSGGHRADSSAAGGTTRDCRATRGTSR
jgi:hypothetical protein